MIREKMRLDRECVLREEARAYRAMELFRRVLGELGPGECLGDAVRRGSEIVIPIERTAEAEAREAEADAVRRLVSAWLDRPAGAGEEGEKEAFAAGPAR